MIDILPAAPHGTTDQMSPTHAPVPNQYGGVKADDAKRLKEFEKENARLKRLVADQALDIDMLKEVK